MIPLYVGVLEVCNRTTNTQLFFFHNIAVILLYNPHRVGLRVGLWDYMFRTFVDSISILFSRFLYQSICSMVLLVPPQVSATPRNLPRAQDLPGLI